MKYSALALAAGASLLATSCAQTSFSPAQGMTRYKSLAKTYEVDVADEVTDLPQPAIVLGDLQTTFRAGDDSKQDSAIGLMSLHARHYGCDALVGLNFELVDEPARGASSKKKKADGDKPAKTSKVYRWTASCVRTAQADGGLTDRDVARAGGRVQTAAVAPNRHTAPKAKPVAAADTAPPRTKVASAQPAKTAPKTAVNPSGPAATAPTVTSVPSASTGGGAEVVKPDRTVNANARKLWEMLRPHGRFFLRAWRQQLEGEPRSAMEVVEALTELMIKVVGPAGVWRSRLPRWFGCATYPDSLQCLRIGKIAKSLATYDRMLTSMERVRPANAAGWLNKNMGRIKSMFTTLVPEAPRLSSLKQTPTYQKYLEGISMQ